VRKGGWLEGGIPFVIEWYLPSLSAKAKLRKEGPLGKGTTEKEIEICSRIIAR
jgi:hypothetical protein